MNVVAVEFLRLAMDVSLKAAVMAVIAGAGLSILRAQNSNLRHRVWAAVLIAMLLMPLLVAISPSVRLPASLYPAWQRHIDQSLQSPKAGAPSSPKTIEPDAVNAELAKRPAESRPDAATVALATSSKKTDSDLDDRAIDPATREAISVFTVTPWLVLIAAYLIGATLFLGRLIVGLWRASRLCRSAQPISVPATRAHVFGPTPVRESPRICVPLTVGWLRPRILLPDDWSTWDDSLLAAAIAHEEAHVERRDQWIALLAELNRAVYWIHPVAWFLRHRLAALAEGACDDAVIERLGDRSLYARHLIDVAGRLGNAGWRIRPAGIAMARTSRVEKRVNSILDNGRPLARKLGTAGAIALLTVAVPLVLLAAGLKGADRPVEPTPAAIALAPTDAPAILPAASSPTPLRGRVVMQSDGSPVANADVRLVTWNSDNTHYDTKKTRSDSEGNFEFKAVPGGTNRLAAFSGDFASRQSLYKGNSIELPADGTAIEPITLEMIKCPSIAVHVVDKAGSKPIANALVRLVWTDTERDHYTNDQGDVTLPRLTHEVWHAEVHAKGYAEEMQAINLAETEAANLSFELVPGGVLYGTIVDDAGTPVAGAGFSVFPANFSGEQIEYMVTDREGKFSFPYLPLDKGLELDVSKEGYTRTRQQTSLADAPGHERKLDLVLKQRPNGGAVGGKVVGPDGKPIAGATIANHGKSSTEVRTATTDANGEFLLADVFEGSIGHELIVKAQGFAPQRLPFQPGTPDKPAEIAISLAAGHRIHGKLVDEGGNPIAAAQVYFANGNWGDGMDFGGRATTGADGKFAFDSLPDRTPFNVVARGYSEINGQQLPLDGDEEVVVTMRSAGIIRGRVVDDKTGLPIKSFNVNIAFSPDRKPDEPDTGLTGPRATSPTGERFANSDGLFRLDGLVRDMPLQVTVMADGYDRQTVRRVVAVADAEAKAVDYRLAPLGNLGETQIRGHLVDADAKPVEGAELRLIVAEKRPFPRDRYPFNWQMIRSGQVQSAGEVSQFLTATTDQDGAFSFDHVRGGADLELAYWGEGVSQARREHLEKLSEADRQDVRIAVVAPGIVRGTIDRASFPSVSNVMLMPTRGIDGFDASSAVISSDTTKYEIRNVPPGSYELQVYGDSIRPEGGQPGSIANKVLHRHAIAVRSGETVTYDIAAGDKPAETTKRSANEGGPKANDAVASSEAPSHVKVAVTDAVQSSPQTTPDAVRVVGRVTDEKGNGVGGAQLWLPARFDAEEEGKYTVTATAASDGSFALDVPANLLIPGNFTPGWTVWCYAPGHRIATASAYQAMKRKSADPVAITLLPETDTAFVVTDPMGHAVAGARVEPWHCLTVAAYEIVPAPLRKLVGGTTDEQGRAALPAMGRDGFFQFRVETAAYGIQNLRLVDKESEPAERKIELRETGKIDGALISGDREAIHDLRVYAYQEDFMGQHTAGDANTRTDKDGKFTIEHFAEGPVHLGIVVDKSLPLRPRVPERIEVNAGKTTKLVIPLEAAVRVRGIVRTKEEQIEVPGATVSVQSSGFQNHEQAVTDADGRFEAYVLPGSITQQMIIGSEKYDRWMEEAAGWEKPFNVAAGQVEAELPAIELVPTFERAGRVVDRENRPVANGQVSAVAANRVYAMSKSDAEGKFTLWLPKAPVMQEFKVYVERDNPADDVTIVQAEPFVLQINR